MVKKLIPRLAKLILLTGGLCETMKRITIIVIMISLVLSALSSNDATASSQLESIPNYHSIPGVTQEEIAAVEALKATRGTFSLGHLNTTESFRKSDGEYTGFVLEICRVLSSLLDVQVTPKAYEDWGELKKDIDSWQTDFSAEFTYTPERAKIYDMTTPIAGRRLKAYTLKAAMEVTSEADVEGKRIGFLGGEEIANSIHDVYSEVHFQVVNVTGFSNAVELLLSGEIDVFVTDEVADSIFDVYDYIRGASIFPFVSMPVSITTANPDLKPIISLIDKYLENGGMETMFALYIKSSYEYKKYKLNESFTQEEKDYVADLKKRNAKVKVALMHDAYPASFYNTMEKRYDGAAYDILMQVSELTGISFDSECMPVEKALSDILEKLRSGEISMMPQLLYSESRKNDYIWSDTSYITTHYALLSKSDLPDLQPFQVYYATVGTVDESVHEEVFKKAFPDHSKMIAYKTGDDVFDALEKGEIDLVMLSETMLLVQTNYREKLGYKVNMTFGKTLDTLYGFNKEETILRDIFDKSLNYIDVAGIEEDWLNRSYDYQSKFYRDAIPYIIATVLTLLVAFAIVFILLIKNRRLSKNLEHIVTERTRELENKTTTLSTIYNAIPDLVFCKDVNENYTSCNPSFEEFAGRTEEYIIGKNDKEVFGANKKIKTLLMPSSNMILSNDKPEIVEELVTYPNGKQKLMETIKTTLVKKNEVIGMIGISRDITQHKELEQKLIEAKELAEKNSKAKTDFLSRMSHEMRTPMNAIIGMTEIGKKSGELERKDYALDKIESASTHLLGVINDVLDISKIEAGKFELANTEFALKKMLSKIVSVMQFRMEEKQLHFCVDINENVPETAITDEQHLSQVITNLLGNAIKFTPNGGDISLFVENMEEKKDVCTIQFVVKDSGIGIPKEQQKKLFAAFEQGDGSVSRKYGGTGLGLAISKHIVEMMGGDIWIESSVGEGSRFIFTIKVQKSDSQTNKVNNAEKSDHNAAGVDYTQAALELHNCFAGKHILLAEDVEINREIVMTLLEDTDIQIDCAENGEIAFQMFQTNPNYDLILMDIHMPEVDGYTATRRIRALSEPRAKTIPIIAMTANVFAEDIERCINAGMNAHIGKPINLSNMMTTLGQYLLPEKTEDRKSEG